MSSKPVRGYSWRAGAVVAGCHLVAIVSLIAFVWWELAHQPAKPPGCVDTCFGNIPTILAVAAPSTFALCLAVGLSPGLLRRLYTDARLADTPIRLGLLTAARAFGYAIAATLILCGLLVVIALIG